METETTISKHEYSRIEPSTSTSSFHTLPLRSPLSRQSHTPPMRKRRRMNVSEERSRSPSNRTNQSTTDVSRLSPVNNIRNYSPVSPAIPHPTTWKMQPSGVTALFAPYLGARKQRMSTDALNFENIAEDRPSGIRLENPHLQGLSIQLLSNTPNIRRIYTLRGRGVSLKKRLYISPMYWLSVDLITVILFDSVFFSIDFWGPSDFT